MNLLQAIKNAGESSGRRRLLTRKYFARQIGACKCPRKQIGWRNMVGWQPLGWCRYGWAYWPSHVIESDERRWAFSGIGAQDRWMKTVRMESP